MITMMRDVFEDALRTLGLVDRQDPLTAMIAREVIELAQDGERDPDRLKQLTLEAFDRKTQLVAVCFIARCIFFADTDLGAIGSSVIANRPNQNKSSTAT